MIPDYLVGAVTPEERASVSKPAVEPKANGNGADTEPIAVELPVVSASSFAGKDVPARQWLVVDFVPDKNVSLLASRPIYLKDGV